MSLSWSPYESRNKRRVLEEIIERVVHTIMSELSGELEDDHALIIKTAIRAGESMLAYMLDEIYDVLLTAAGLEDEDPEIVRSVLDGEADISQGRDSEVIMDMLVRDRNIGLILWGLRARIWLGIRPHEST